MDNTPCTFCGAENNKTKISVMGTGTPELDETGEVAAEPKSYQQTVQEVVQGDTYTCGQCQNSMAGTRIILGTADKDIPFCSSFCKDKYIQQRDEKRADMIKPDYYHTDNVYEPFKIIRYYGLNFFEGNVLKYLLRAGKKNAATRLEDLQKAATYLASEIEQTKKEQKNK